MRRQGQRQEVERAGLGELHEERRAVAHHRDRHFLVAQVVHDDPEDEWVGQRGQPEVDPGEAEGRRADQQRGQHGDHRARQHAEPGGDAGSRRQQHGDVGADAEEGLVAERDLPGVAADDVPGEAHRRPQEHEREDAVVIALGDDEGQPQAERHDRGDAEPAPPPPAHVPDARQPAG